MPLIRLRRAVIAVTAGLALSAVAQTVPPGGALTIGFHMVMPCDSRGASKAMQVTGRSTSYCLERAAFVSQNDVVSAAINSKEESPAEVALTLNQDAARRWEEKISKSIGAQVGIVVDGRLLAAPTIAAPSAKPAIRQLTREEAASIVQRIQSGTVARTISELPAGASPPKRADTAPMLVSKRDPEYTREAKAARIQGTVVLGLVVETDGTPQNIRVLRSLDPGLDAKAVECVRTWRFLPGRREGQPVPVKATIEVNFRL